MKHAPRTTTTFPLGLENLAARDAKHRDPTDGGIVIFDDECAAHARLVWHARGEHYWARCGTRDFGSVASTATDTLVDVDAIPADRRAALEVMVRDWILAALRRPGAVTTTGARDVTTTRIPLGIFARQARDLVRRARAECRDGDDAHAIYIDPRTDEATIEGRFTVDTKHTKHTLYTSNLWHGRSVWSVGDVTDDVRRRDMVIASVRESFAEMVADLVPLDTGLGSAIDEAAPLRPQGPAWMQMLEDLALPDDMGRPWQEPGTRRAHVTHDNKIATWRCKRVDGVTVDITRDVDGGWTTTRIEDAPRPTVPLPVSAESLDLAVARAIHEVGQPLTVARIAVSPDAVAGDHPAGPGLRRALDQVAAALTCLRGAYERTVARG